MRKRTITLLVSATMAMTPFVANAAGKSVLGDIQDKYSVKSIGDIVNPHNFTIENAKRPNKSSNPEQNNHTCFMIPDDSIQKDQKYHKHSDQHRPTNQPVKSDDQIIFHLNKTTQSALESYGFSGSLGMNYGLFSVNTGIKSQTENLTEHHGVDSYLSASRIKNIRLSDQNKIKLTPLGKKQADNLSQAFPESMADIDLNSMKDIKHLSQKQQKALNNFANTCGTTMIDRLKVGSSLRAHLNITSDSSALKNSISAHAGAEVSGFGKLNAAVSDAHEETNDTVNVSASLEKSGYDGKIDTHHHMTSCDWDGDQNQLNADCKKFMNDAEDIADNLLSGDVSDPDVIEFPSFDKITNEVNLDPGAHEALSQVIDIWHDAYNDMSDHYANDLSLYDKLNHLISDNQKPIKQAFPKTSIIYQSLQDKNPELTLDQLWNDYLKKLKVLLDTVTSQDYVSVDQKNKFDDLDNAFRNAIPAELKDVLNNLSNDQSNDTDRVYNFNHGVVEKASQYRHFGVGINQQTYKEVVIGNQVVNDHPADGNLDTINDLYHLPSINRNICSQHVDKSKTTLGYALTYDDYIHPFVVHTYKNNDGNCLIYMDQDTSNITGQDFDQRNKQASNIPFPIDLNHNQEWIWMPRKSNVFNPDNNDPFMILGQGDQGYHPNMNFPYQQISLNNYLLGYRPAITATGPNKTQLFEVNESTKKHNNLWLHKLTDEGGNDFGQTPININTGYFPNLTAYGDQNQNVAEVHESDNGKNELYLSTFQASDVKDRRVNATHYGDGFHPSITSYQTKDHPILIEAHQGKGDHRHDLYMYKLKPSELIPDQDKGTKYETLGHVHYDKGQYPAVATFQSQGQHYIAELHQGSHDAYQHQLYYKVIDPKTMLSEGAQRIISKHAKHPDATTIHIQGADYILVTYQDTQINAVVVVLIDPMSGNIVGHKEKLEKGNTFPKITTFNQKDHMPEILVVSRSGHYPLQSNNQLQSNKLSVDPYAIKKLTHHHS